MTQTIVGLFDTPAQANQVVQDLVSSGVRREDISIVANDATGEYTRAVGDTSDTASAAGAGALSGGVLGGVLGLLVGIGALAIPGIGPVVAAGPLAAALGSAGAGTLIGAGTGAVTGGLLGALVGAGVPETDAHVYTEGVRRGGTLVSVTSTDERSSYVVDIMRRNGVVDINNRGNEWRQSGWDRFDPASGPYEADWQQSSKVGTTGGAVAGAATGAAIGSAGGPIGTIVGGAAGAAAGAGIGSAGDVAGERAEDDQDDPNRTRPIR
ncbi:MAG TPA: general stress protein [Roseiflexaceae bacterium]|nr:general stress protein [Roseiflexaceae bacterium]